MKAICLNKLCSKFEVDINKIEVTMQFCLCIIPPGAIQNHCIFSHIYKILSYCYAHHKITTKYGILRLRPFR